MLAANRYREYDVWRNRVRIVQTGLMAEAFAPGGGPDGDWQARLGEDLRNPALDISFREALNHRLRRSYLALLAIFGVAWIARITVFVPDESWERTAGILLVPGEVVGGAIALFYAILVAITAWSARGTRTEEFQT